MPNDANVEMRSCAVPRGITSENGWSPAFEASRRLLSLVSIVRWICWCAFDVAGPPDAQGLIEGYAPPTHPVSSMVGCSCRASCAFWPRGLQLASTSGPIVWIGRMFFAAADHEVWHPFYLERAKKTKELMASIRVSDWNKSLAVFWVVVLSSTGVLSSKDRPMLALRSFYETEQ